MPDWFNIIMQVESEDISLYALITNSYQNEI